MSVVELFEAASPEIRQLVTDLLEQDASGRAWAGQMGPCLTQADTARLLDKSEQATAKDARLLRVKTRSGRVVYPVVQFAGRSAVAGIQTVTEALTPVVDPLTITAWLTNVQPSLDGRRPIDALRAGEVDAVQALARRFATTAA